MRFRIISIFAVVFICQSLIASAQDPAISVETNLVTMNVAVTDRTGRFVRGLTRSDFAVEDGGKEQQIDVFSANDDALSIGIVYDMHNMDEMSASVLEALKRFIGRLGPNDDYFVTIFNEKGSLTSQVVPDNEQLRRHLADPVKGSPSSLYDAIVEAGRRTRNLNHAKKYLIVFTDGADQNSKHSVRDLRNQLRSVNLPLYVVNFTPDDRRRYSYVDVLREGPRQAFQIGETSELDRNVLAELSGSTGGQAYESSVRNRVYLAALATKFLDEARNQYVIGFYPDANDGKWHKLKVSAKGERSKNLRISSRTGYQSAAAAKN